MLKDAYSAAQFMLEFYDEGDALSRVGFCRSVEGGGIRAEVLSYRFHVGNQWHVNRQIAARPKFDDIKFEVGMSLSEDFYVWIEEFFRGGAAKNGGYSRRSGAITSADIGLVPRVVRTFHNALISEVAFPKLDASDTNAAYLGVTIVPESIATEFPENQEPIKVDNNPQEQKLWAPNNFTFSVDGFDETFIRAVRIDGFSIRQEILAYDTPYRISNDAQGAPTETGPGQIRVPGLIEFPNLSVYVPESDIHNIYPKFQDVVVARKQSNLRNNGYLTFQGHAGEELCRINLENLEIASITPERGDAGSRDVKLAKIEFSCERMVFDYPTEAEQQSAASS